MLLNIILGLAQISLDNSNYHFQLPEGRRIGYCERGPSNGKPMLYLHGSPSSRLESELFLSTELLNSLNIRLIAVDRPGFGISDFQRNRRILDWPDDVIALADHLEIDSFAILAYSLGGPYALACAFSIPQRLNKVGIVSGAALFTEPNLIVNINEGTRKFLTMPRETPLLSRLLLWLMLGIVPRVAPNMFIRQSSSFLPDPDRSIVVSDPTFQKGFINMIREATKQGVKGAFHESLLVISDWGFQLEGIRSPVWLWHGGRDQNIPLEMARHAAEAIPNCEAEFHADEGHLSLFKKKAENIISELAYD